MKILIVSNTTKDNYSAVEDKLSMHDISFADVPGYIEKVKDFEYVIAGREPYTEDILKDAKKLRVISRCGHGTDAIDKEYCRENGIAVLDARGALDDTIADLTIGYMVMALRRLKEIDKGTREEGWKPVLGRDLTGKTVGIIGLGGIGTAVAERLSGFRTNTLFYDIDPEKQHDYIYAKYVDLDELLKMSDIITLQLHCVLDKKAKPLIDRDAIRKMKEGVILINTSRGGMIAVEDLVEALECGKVDYAVLDVYPIEPLPKDDIVRNVENVLLGAHTAYYSIEGRRALAMKAVDNLLGEI